MKIEIAVENKVAKGDGQIIVCDNSDYTVGFTFDEEWEAHPIKTMRVLSGGKYYEVVFDGDTVPLPKLDASGFCEIGVYSGDLHSTTPALFRVQKSILTEDGALHEPPAEDIYNQLVTMINGKQDKLPEVIKDRFLHTNTQSGELEWSQGSGGGGGSVEWGNIGGQIQNQTDLAAVLSSYADEIDRKINNDAEGVSGALYNLNFNSEAVTDETQIVVQNNSTSWVRRKLSVISEWIMSKVAQLYIPKTSLKPLCQHYLTFGSSTYGSMWFGMKVLNKSETPITMDSLAQWLFASGYSSGANAFMVESSSTLSANLDSTGAKLWSVYACSSASGNPADIVFYVCNSSNTNHRQITIANAGVNITSNQVHRIGYITE